MLNERFWSKVAKQPAPGCWLWTANKNNMGYGLFRPGGTAPKRLAHRLAFVDQYGPIPDGGLVLHNCDNPACVNPRHLRLGSHSDNIKDSWQRTRKIRNNTWSRPPILRGDDHPFRKNPALIRRGEQIGNSVLTTDKVHEIYRMRMADQSQRGIARHFGIDNSTVADICRGERWGHLLGKDGAPTLEQLLAIHTAIAATKLQRSDIPEIRRLLAAGMTGVKIASHYGVHKATISDIRRGLTWADV